MTFALSAGYSTQEGLGAIVNTTREGRRFESESMGQEEKLISRYPVLSWSSARSIVLEKPGTRGLSRRILTDFQSKTSGPRRGDRTVGVGFTVKEGDQV